MTREDYDRILEEAFSFLIAEFGYSSQPARTGGGLFGSGLHKTFTRGRQTIALLVGDADSQLFCNVFFSDGDDMQVEPSRRLYRQRTLGFLLMRKGVDFNVAGTGSPASDATVKEALVAVGNLVKEHAIDVVDGDFSAFPELVYAVHHVDRRYPTGEVRRLIGVYSSFSEATKAISERLTQPGFVVRQDGFEVGCVELNWGNWVAGIPIRTPEQETEFFRRTLKAASLSEFNSDERREIEAEWFSKFAAFQDRFEVSRAKAAELHSSMRFLVADFRNRPLGLECWRTARESGNLSSAFVAFIDAELRDLK